MKPLLKIGPADQVFTAGLFPSVNADAAPLWHDGQNVIFTPSDVRKAPGLGLVYDFADVIRDLAQALVFGEKRIYVALAESVWKVVFASGGSGFSAGFTSGFGGASPFSVTQIGTLTGDYLWPQLETWGSWVFVNDTVNPLEVWKNSGTSLTPVVTPFSQAKIIKRFSPFMLAANTSNGGEVIEWSTASDAENWTPALSNHAGNTTIRDLGGDILAVQDLGKNLAFYSGNSLVLGRFVGFPNVFHFEKTIRGVGVTGRRAVVSLGAFNYGLGKQGVFKTDGFNYVFVDNPALRDWLKTYLPSSGEPISGYHHQSIGHIVWHFKDINGDLRGIGFNPENGACTRINYGLYAAIERDVFDNPFGGKADKLVKMDYGWNDLDVPLGAWIRTKPLDCTAQEFNKLWEGMRAYVKSGSSGIIKIYVGDEPEAVQELIYTGSMTHAVDIKPMRESIYITLEFRCEDLDEFFKLSGFMIEGEIAGPS